MTALGYILAGILLLCFGGIFYYLSRIQKSTTQRQTDDQALKVMMEWMKQIKDSADSTRQEIQKNMDSTSKTMNERLDNAARVIGEVKKELGQVQQIGKTFSYVQDFLLSAKKRGNVGEQIMEEMLRQALPTNMYAFQHRFNSGDTVDAVIKIKEHLLCMDSKFSMENYRAYINAETEDLRQVARKTFIRDVKKRIDEVSKKYIVPAENTFDFALMYVPAEGVFNEVSDDAEVYEYSRSRRVHMVSPSTFHYFLQIILLGLQRERINETAEHILKAIKALKQDSEKFAGDLNVLTKHITNAKATVDSVGGQYGRIHSKINEVAGLKIEKAPDEITDKIQDKIPASKDLPKYGASNMDPDKTPDKTLEKTPEKSKEAPKLIS